MKKSIKLISFVISFSFSIVLAQTGTKNVVNNLSLFGFLATNYQSAPTLDADNNFNIRIARVGVKGLYKKNIGYQVLGELVSPKYKTPIFLQGWLEYYFPYYIKLRIGQFKYEFGQETLPSYMTWKLINASYVSSGIGFKLGRTGNMFRDIGAMISTKYEFTDKFIVYGSIMVMNGNGINTLDNNKKKDFVFHSHFSLFLNIETGVSYYLGNSPDSSNINLNESAVSFYIKMIKEKYSLQAEYMSGNYDNGINPSNKPAGYYITSTYKLVPELELAFRYDFFDNNKNIEDDDLSRLTFGIAYHFSKLNRILLNYEFRNSSFNKEIDDLVTLQFYLTLK